MSGPVGWRQLEGRKLTCRSDSNGGLVLRIVGWQDFKRDKLQPCWGAQRGLVPRLTSLAQLIPVSRQPHYEVFHFTCLRFFEFTMLS